MTTHHTTRVSASVIQDELLAFLTARTKAPAAVDEDLFGSGLVSSMFVMELVVHLEQTYDVMIIGKDLTMDNFRTVVRMAELVLRLRNTVAASGA